MAYEYQPRYPGGLLTLFLLFFFFLTVKKWEKVLISQQSGYWDTFISSTGPAVKSLKSIIMWGSAALHERLLHA